MIKTWIILIIFGLTRAEESEKYFGIPISKIPIGDDGKSLGDVFAADSKTLIINSDHIENLGSPKCTRILGTLKPEENSQSPPQVVRNPRFKRQGFSMQNGQLTPQLSVMNPNQHPLDWPFEFGHLRVDDDGEPSPIAASESGSKKSQDPFGVELSNSGEEIANETAVDDTKVDIAPESTVRTTKSKKPTTTVAPKSTTTSAGKTSKSTSPIPEVALSSIVLHSSIETESKDEENVTNADVNLEEESTDPSDADGTSDEPSPIGPIEDPPEVPEPGDDEHETRPPASEALWARPTSEPEGGSEIEEPVFENASNATESSDTKEPSSEATKKSKSANTRRPTQAAKIDESDQATSGGDHTTSSTQASERGYPTQFPTGRPGKHAGNKPASILRQLPVEYFGGLNVPDELEGKNGTLPDQPAVATQPRPSSVPDGEPQAVTIVFGGPRKTTLTPPVPQTAAEAAFRGLPPAPPSAPSASAPGVQERPVESEPASNSTAAPVVDFDAFNETVDCAGKAWCVVPDPHRRRTRPPTEATTTPPAPENAGGWYVVEDRRAHRREDATSTPVAAATATDATPEPTLVRAKRKVLLAKINPKKPYQKIRKSQDTAIGVNKFGKSHGKVFLTSEFKDNKITIRIPEPYDLSDFESIGIYDVCKKAKISTISLQNVQYPREIQLPGFRGLQYNLKSEQIQILNCNSILIKNFSYSGAQKTRAYFFVVTGSYPLGVAKKIQATVVGEPANQPLKNYQNQDILVRLPPHIRTMNISQLTVMSDDGKVYAQIAIPQSSVPPCD